MKHAIIILSSLCVAWIFHSCKDLDDLQSDTARLEDRVAAIEEALAEMNASIEGLNDLLAAKTVIVGVTSVEAGYEVELSDGRNLILADAGKSDFGLPLIGIDEQGYWTCSLGGGTPEQILDPKGNPISAYAMSEDGDPVCSPHLRVSADGYWQVSCDGEQYEYVLQKGERIPAVSSSGPASIFREVTYDAEESELTVVLQSGGTILSFPVIDTFYLRVKGADEEQVFPLSECREYEVEQGEVAEAAIRAPEGWKVVLEERKLTITAPDVNPAGKDLHETINLLITSPKSYIRVVPIKVKLLTVTYDMNACTAWNEFAAGSDRNVLLDFSYAGYAHGEEAPPEMRDLIAQGYKVYNVLDYGAVPGDGKSDRAAVTRILEALGATFNEEDGGKTERYVKNGPARAIIYFPEGEYVLLGPEDHYETLRISMSDLVIKGAGRDKTVIRKDVVSDDGTSTNMWAGATMLNIKHNSGLSKVADVTGNAAAGTFSVTVGSTSGINAGDWVCLKLVNNDPELIASELAPYQNVSSWTDLNTTGIQIYDYHQVRTKSGNTLTFHEPLMHKIESRWGWTVERFPHYENVGIEDLTFAGQAKEDFVHHGSGADDSGYKIVDFGRLTNSWMRRVTFTSVSEASSFQSCANCSAYDIRIDGNRGHAAVRSQASSRIFIGKVVDESNGYMEIDRTGTLGSEYMEGLGQFHACGVSKQSMGAVLWNVRWGSDACFEAHASQPRSTLIDCCTGTFMPFRQGGDWASLPNHWENLTIWNMNATKVSLSYYEADWGGVFKWWTDDFWNFLHPIVVGFHGAAVTFDESQMTRNESCGSAVEPYSLYEAQLRRRLGVVPAWLNSLK